MYFYWRRLNIDKYVSLPCSSVSDKGRNIMWGNFVPYLYIPKKNNFKMSRIDFQKMCRTNRKLNKRVHRENFFLVQNEKHALTQKAFISRYYLEHMVLGNSESQALPWWVSLKVCHLGHKIKTKLSLVLSQWTRHADSCCVAPRINNLMQK